MKNSNFFFIGLSMKQILKSENVIKFALPFKYWKCNICTSFSEKRRKEKVKVGRANLQIKYFLKIVFR